MPSFVCPECKSKHVIKAGFKVTRKGRIPRMQCQDCGLATYARNFRVESAKKKGKA